MASRNTATSVRPMISGLWFFCESIISIGKLISFCKKNRVIVRESLAKAWREKAFP